MPRQQIYLIGPMNNQITGSKLPSKRDCLSVLFYNMRLVNLNLHDSSRLVIDECSIFWKKARIPTHDNSDCTKKLKKLYEEWRKLDKNKTRTSELQKTHENKFEEQLDNLFDISHANALNLIKIEEDKQFLFRQREKGRPGCMLGTDMKLAGIEKRKATLKENEDERKKRREMESLKLTERIRLDSSSSSEDQDTVFEEVFDRVNNETKQRMANYILEGKEHYSNDSEEENEESKKKINLKFDDLTHFLNKDHPFDLLTNKSWKLFARFQISDIFLQADPSTWKDIEEYKQAKEVISSLKIVNDAAERGVKLMEEYNQKFSKNEEQKQFTLQVVQEYRKTFPGCSREILKKNFEY